MKTTWVGKNNSGVRGTGRKSREGIATLSLISCPKSPGRYEGWIHTVVPKSITQTIENQRFAEEDPEVMDFV